MGLGQESAFEPRRGQRHKGEGKERGRAVGNVIEVNDATFEGEVLKADKPVLVHFWAPACPPCAAMYPILESLARKLFDGRVKFVKLNAATERKTAAKYHIAAVPTLIIFKDGEIIDTWVGFTAETDLRRRIEAVKK